MAIRLVVFVFFLSCFELRGAESAPAFTATNLCMKTYSFPTKKLELLIFGFQVESYENVIEWVRAFRKQNSTSFSVSINTIPVVGDSLTVKLLRPVLFSALRLKAAEKDHEHVFLCFDNARVFEKAFGGDCADSKGAFVLLVSPTGEILWKAQGKPSSVLCKNLQSSLTEYFNSQKTMEALSKVHFQEQS